MRKFFITTTITFVAGLLISLGFQFHFQKISKMNKDIHPEFQHLYTKFINEAMDHGLNLSGFGVRIAFAQIPPKDGPFAKSGVSTLGECSVIIGKLPVIQIDQARWSRMSSTQKEMTLYHELGHCFLLKGHTDTMHQGVNLSLMNPSIFNESVYQENRERYMNELFGYRAYNVKDYLVTFFIKPGYERVYRFFLEKKQQLVAVR